MLGSNLITFRPPAPQQHKQVLRPPWAKPGEQIVVVTTDVPLAWGCHPPGTEYRVLKGRYVPGACHAVEFGDDLYLGMLRPDLRPGLLCFVSWHDGLRSGCYPAEELRPQILGFIYPIDFGSGFVIETNPTRGEARERDIPVIPFELLTKVV